MATLVEKKDLIQITDVTWEIPTSYREDMRVPVRIFADEALIDAALGDKSFDQAVNTSTLPGLVSPVVVMPDVHQGYGFPIGGVAASRYPDGIISPGAIGYDINCGVRLLASGISFADVKRELPDLALALDANCPSGVGVGGSVRLTTKELDKVCRQGSAWAALKNNYARRDDLERTEEQGQIHGADPSSISSRAKQRGKGQLGTLGAGNHFIEIDVVDEIFHEAAAKAMGPRSTAARVGLDTRSAPITSANFRAL